MTRIWLAAVLACTACAAPTVWTREGATDKDFRMEQAQCRVVAAQVVDGVIALATYENCLIGKGWARSRRP